MKTSDRLDAVIASVPANATAARVMARGEHWTPEKVPPPGLLHWESPPPIKPFVGTAGQDYTGKKFGRFTVVGLLGISGGKNRGERWVVRCSCSHFEARTPQSIALRVAGYVIEDGNPMWDRCWWCAQWAVTQNRYAKKGAKPLSDFTSGPAKEKVRKNPLLIIADTISESHKGDATATAAAIFSAICSGGYHIVREPLPHYPPRSLLQSKRKTTDG